MSFFDALVYTLAYFPVISALACIDNPLPMPTTVHELRGQSYMRHRASYAGILHESRRQFDIPHDLTYTVNKQYKRWEETS
ncbi:hypothetical protein BKH15_12670 [Actinomyces oris]|uniref:Uncharacterized protein n=1 Tax=Actinomyces oris TaxID=544580 RepID=A0A1Q8X1E9_9ACTO|nr:hypothetical protein BKH15_12670 [Actinomyces oris]